MRRFLEDKLVDAKIDVQEMFGHRKQANESNENSASLRQMTMSAGDIFSLQQQQGDSGRDQTNRSIELH